MPVTLRRGRAGSWWGCKQGWRRVLPRAAYLKDFKRKEFRMPVVEEVRTVTADGRLIVPWVIQRALGLEHGGPVRFRVEDGVVTLVAAETKPAAAPQVAAGVERTRADLRAELVAELKMLMQAADRDR